MGGNNSYLKIAIAFKISDKLFNIVLFIIVRFSKSYSFLSILFQNIAKYYKKWRCYQQHNG